MFQNIELIPSARLDITGTVNNAVFSAYKPVTPL